MIKIITIDREYGSGAADIAATLAVRLGWKLWDERLTIGIARILGRGCPAVEQREERRDTLHYRLFKAVLTSAVCGPLDDCIIQTRSHKVRRAGFSGRAVPNTGLAARWSVVDFGAQLGK